MAVQSAYRRILVLGLAGHAPGAPKMGAAAKLPRGQFRRNLEATKSKAKENGLELEIIQAKATAFSAALTDIRSKLATKPDGFMVGNGIRGTAEYTVFFEDLVNASTEISPQTRLMFNTSPDDILECCLRNFERQSALDAGDDETRAETSTGTRES